MPIAGRIADIGMAIAAEFRGGSFTELSSIAAASAGICPDNDLA